MIGLVYTDEGEASSFMKVVTKKKAAIGVYLRIYLSIIVIAFIFGCGLLSDFVINS